MTARPLAAALALGLLAAGCGPRRPAPVPAVRYVVGSGYQLGGTWYYPREAFQYEATGLAEIVPGGRGLTADGELSDPTALTASHQTLQLPSIVRVTNLENGLELLVRVNDRGPASPARLLGLSPRAGSLLGIGAGQAARVRVQVEEGPSLALREQLGGGPHLALATAPRTAVTQEQLAPPPGVGQSARGRGAAGALAGAQPVSAVAAASVPDRLPETVTQGMPRPGQLMVLAGSFGQASYAAQVQARLSGLGVRVDRVPDGRSTRYELRAGPYPTVAAADAALAQALRAGVSDARIVVE